MVRALPSTTSAEADASWFGSFTGTMARSDSSPACTSGVRLWPSRTGPSEGTPKRSPGSRACSFSACLGSTTARVHSPARATVGVYVAFPLCPQGRHPDTCSRSSIPCPLIPLSTLRRQPRDCLRKTRGQVVRYSFPVRLFHPPLHAGLSRRTTGPLPPLPFLPSGRPSGNTYFIKRREGPLPIPSPASREVHLQATHP